MKETRSHELEGDSQKEILKAEEDSVKLSGEDEPTISAIPLDEQGSVNQTDEVEEAETSEASGLKKEIDLDSPIDERPINGQRTELRDPPGPSSPDSPLAGLVLLFLLGMVFLTLSLKVTIQHQMGLFFGHNPSQSHTIFALVGLLMVGGAYYHSRIKEPRLGALFLLVIGLFGLWGAMRYFTGMPNSDYITGHWQRWSLLLIYLLPGVILTYIGYNQVGETRALTLLGESIFPQAKLELNTLEEKTVGSSEKIGPEPSGGTPLDYDDGGLGLLKKIAIIFTTGLLLLALMVVVVYSYNEEEEKQNFSRALSPDIYVDANGNRHMVWSQVMNHTNPYMFETDIFYFQSKGNGTGTVGPLHISSGPAWSRFPQVLTTPEDKVLITYLQGESRYSKMEFRAGLLSFEGEVETPFTTLFEFEGGESQINQYQVMFDTEGQLHLAWVTGDQLFYQKYFADLSPMTMAKALPQPAENLGFLTLVCDEEGQLHFGWKGQVSKDERAFFYGRLNSTSEWEVAPVQLSEEGSYNTGPGQIHLDEEHQVHVLWAEVRPRGHWTHFYNRLSDNGSKEQADLELRHDLRVPGPGNFHIQVGENPGFYLFFPDTQNHSNFIIPTWLTYSGSHSNSQAFHQDNEGQTHRLFTYFHGKDPQLFYVVYDSLAQISGYPEQVDQISFLR